MATKRKASKTSRPSRAKTQAPRSVIRSPKPRQAIQPVRFIESMECLAVPELPEGPEWTYEIKLDGFRLEPVKNDGEVVLYSRRGNVLNRKFPYIAPALESLPNGTVIDGEVVALDKDNRSDFSLLQNFRSAETRIHFYAFDILVLKGKPLTALPLSERRRILADVLPINDHVTLATVDPRPVAHILKFVKAHGLEGVVAKRADSPYEAARRSGLWSKHRINQGQEFVVGGYTPGSNGFDALIVGFYINEELHFAARVRNGFVPATRRQVFHTIKQGTRAKCPFVNLPDKDAGRWGQGLTADKMNDCVWLVPKIVVRLDFLEWTGSDRLRHPKFIGLRDDKDPLKVVKEAS